MAKPTHKIPGKGRCAPPPSFSCKGEPEEGAQLAKMQIQDRRMERESLGRGKNRCSKDVRVPQGSTAQDTAWGEFQGARHSCGHEAGPSP